MNTIVILAIVITLVVVVVIRIMVKNDEASIRCPYCHRPSDEEWPGELKCNTCGTTMNVDAKGNILDYEVPEYHDRTIFILTIVSFALVVILLIDAALSKHTFEKMKTMAIVAAVLLCSTLLFPYRFRVSFIYARFSIMIALTFSLLVVLILHLGNFIVY